MDVVSAQMRHVAWLLVLLSPFGAGPYAAEPASDAAPSVFARLADGVEYATFEPTAGDTFHVVRVDPKRAELSAHMASAMPDKQPRTTQDWCDQKHLVAAINLGMYLDDHRRNVGYAVVDGHKNHDAWHPEYKSVLVWNPLRAELPRATIIDLDSDGARERIAQYRSAVQNLRLIKAPGKNVWADQPRAWSEAAIALDTSGRILFVFAKRGHKMIDFNRVLLALPLDVTAAMHVEGGPEASLCVRGKDASHDLFGSFETGFWPRDDNPAQWKIPNVIGVRPAAPTKPPKPPGSPTSKK